MVTHTPDSGFGIRAFRYDDLSDDIVGAIGETLQSLGFDVRVEEADFLDFFVEHADYNSGGGFSIGIEGRLREFDSEGELLRGLCEEPAYFEKVLARNLVA